MKLVIGTRHHANMHFCGTELKVVAGRLLAFKHKLLLHSFPRLLREMAQCLHAVMAPVLRQREKQETGNGKLNW